MTNVTCGLTAKIPGSAPCSALVIEYETTFLSTICYMVGRSVCLSLILSLLNNENTYRKHKKWRRQRIRFEDKPPTYMCLGKTDSDIAGRVSGKGLSRLSDQGRMVAMSGGSRPN